MTEGLTTSDGLACLELVELVTDYLEGRLSAEDHRRFEEHLAFCGPCTKYVEQMRITVRLVGRLREKDLDEPVREAMLAAFRDWRRP
jgi:anti-sigma factor RsiW